MRNSGRRRMRIDGHIQENSHLSTFADMSAFHCPDAGAGMTDWDGDGRPPHSMYKRQRRHKRTPWATERYAPGHKETPEEYFLRGGCVTHVTTRGISRHLLEEQSLVNWICGGTEEDQVRGFAWAEIPPDVRQRALNGRCTTPEHDEEEIHT